MKKLLFAFGIALELTMTARALAFHGPVPHFDAPRPNIGVPGPNIGVPRPNIGAPRPNLYVRPRVNVPPTNFARGYQQRIYPYRASVAARKRGPAAKNYGLTGLRAGMSRGKPSAVKKHELRAGGSGNSLGSDSGSASSNPQTAVNGGGGSGVEFSDEQTAASSGIGSGSGQIVHDCIKSPRNGRCRRYSVGFRHVN